MKLNEWRNEFLVRMFWRGHCFLNEKLFPLRVLLQSLATISSSNFFPLIFSLLEIQPHLSNIEKLLKLIKFYHCYSNSTGVAPEGALQWASGRRFVARWRTNVNFANMKFKTPLASCQSANIFLHKAPAWIGWHVGLFCEKYWYKRFSGVTGNCGKELSGTGNVEIWMMKM